MAIVSQYGQTHIIIAQLLRGEIHLFGVADDVVLTHAAGQIGADCHKKWHSPVHIGKEQVTAKILIRDPEDGVGGDIRKGVSQGAEVFIISSQRFPEVQIDLLVHRPQRVHNQHLKIALFVESGQIVQLCIVCHKLSSCGGARIITILA